MNDITSHVTPKDDQTPPKTPENPDKKKRKQSTPKRVTRKQANALVIDSDIAIQDALAQLQNVQELAAKAGLSVECNTLPRITVTGILSDHTSNPIDSLGMPNDLQSHVAQLTTGGHFNTDHTIVRTGDERIDRVAELRRNLWRRHRLTQPEERQEGRWDRPRLPGERRRRVVRERDLPDAPPEPPLSGYIAFLGQMTVKLRHDRPDMPHDQTKVVQEISKLWRLGLTDDERKYYNRFASDARDEYDRQMVEYRATGTFTPIQEFMKLPEVNVWVRKPSKRNGLEQEICQYETMIFPKRPPSMDEAYAERERRSLFRRKLRVKGLENSDGTLKDGLDFEELFHEHQAKKSKQVEACVKKEDETSTSDDDDAVPLEGQNNENTLLQNIDEGSLVRIPFAMNLSTDN